MSLSIYKDTILVQIHVTTSKIVQKNKQKEHWIHYTLNSKIIIWHGNKKEDIIVRKSVNHAYVCEIGNDYVYLSCVCPQWFDKLSIIAIAYLGTGVDAFSYPKRSAVEAAGIQVTACSDHCVSCCRRGRHRSYTGRLESWKCVGRDSYPRWLRRDSYGFYPCILKRNNHAEIFHEIGMQKRFVHKSFPLYLLTLFKLHMHSEQQWPLNFCTLYTSIAFCIQT